MQGVQSLWLILDKPLEKSLLALNKQTHNPQLSSGKTDISKPSNPFVKQNSIHHEIGAAIHMH